MGKEENIFIGELGLGLIFYSSYRINKVISFAIFCVQKFTRFYAVIKRDKFVHVFYAYTKEKHKLVLENTFANYWN